VTRSATITAIVLRSWIALSFDVPSVTRWFEDDVALVSSAKAGSRPRSVLMSRIAQQHIEPPCLGITFSRLQGTSEFARGRLCPPLIPFIILPRPH